MRSIFYVRLTKSEEKKGPMTLLEAVQEVNKAFKGPNSTCLKRQVCKHESEPKSKRKVQAFVTA